jgi:hypothetical protein
MRVLIDSNVALRCVIDTDVQHELCYESVRQYISSILTLNPDDFARYDIQAMHPKSVV